jgi:hypothetical protein
MKSIIQEDRNYCFLCGRNARADYFGLDEHHCFFGGGLRSTSEEYGLKVYLCHDKCHLNGVHKHYELNRIVRKKAQKIAMQYYGWTVEEFIKLFGKNYLEEGELE